MLVLQQEPARRPQADRRARPSTSATSASTSASTSSPRRRKPRSTDGRVRLPKPVEIKAFLDEYVIGQDAREEAARGRRLQPLQAQRDVPAPQRRRDPEVEHPAHRPDRLGQDAPGADARAAAVGAVRDRRRDHADRGGLRRRGRREHHPQAAAGGRERRREVPARHHLHRRGRQDRAQGREPVDHARRLGRGRAAGAAQDPRGHGRQRAAAGRAQAPAPGVRPGRHDEHPVHLRRGLRRARHDRRAAHRPQDDGLQGRGQGAARQEPRRDARPGAARPT